MNLKKILEVALSIIGLKAFVESEGKKVLSKEQSEKIKASLGPELHAEVLAALEELNAEDVNKAERERQAAAATEAHAQELATLRTQVQEAQQKITDLESSQATSATERAAKDQEIANHKATIAELQGSIAVMVNEPVNKNPKEKPNASAGANSITALNKTYLYAQENPLMKIDEKRPYNQRAYAAIARKYGIMYEAPTASSIDYDSLKSDLGDYYRVRRNDQIQSALIQLKSIEDIFPLESGYDDEAVLVNMFLEEFSQAGNQGSTFGNVVKGGYKLEPEKLKMRDVMFAHSFTNLKELEKQWIGYLNREGSSSYKWSLIEFILIETAKKLHNERELRRVKGVYIAPTLNKPGTAMAACDGVYEFLRNQKNLFKIKEFALGVPTEANIANYIYSMLNMVPAEFRDSGKAILYMPSVWVTRYHKNRETLYGGNQDYVKDIMYVAEYPSVKIKAVPNADIFGRFFVTFDGNISTFEKEPGEMTRFQIELQNWTINVWSEWKESVHAKLVGKKYANAAAQTYDNQFIFMNDYHYAPDYFEPMTADDVTPSVVCHTKLISVSNSAATALTDIDDATIGQLITLRCGNANNAITIAAANKFSLLTAAWAPEVGDEIDLIKRSDGKFIEVARRSQVTDAIEFSADDATPDVAAGTIFITNANTEATAITNLDNADYETIYTIYGAGSTNASTIANSGNFVLTAAMTLAADSWIKLQKSRSNDKFYEIERQNA